MQRVKLVVWYIHTFLDFQNLYGASRFSGAAEPIIATDFNSHAVHSVNQDDLTYSTHTASSFQSETSGSVCKAVLQVHVFLPLQDLYSLLFQNHL